MTLRSQSRENRSKDIYSESTGFATRPEPEVARPETEIAPVVGPSFGDIAAVSSRSQSVESGSEAGVEPQSGYPLPARQEPEITPIPFHPIANPPSFNEADVYDLAVARPYTRAHTRARGWRTLKTDCIEFRRIYTWEN